jgi:FixJ family two-component response regulator
MNIEASHTTVFMVDDDLAVLKALTRLLRAAGFAAQSFQSPEAFLAQHNPDAAGCLVLDICMPDLGGLALQRALTTAGNERFIVFITGHGDIPTSVQAMKDGAVDFLVKPFHDEDFLAAVRCAIARDQSARKMRAWLQAIRRRLATLTPREREVLHHVVAGRLNKQIAADLGTVEKTIKVHRARVMEKMAVASLAELVRVAMQIGLGPAGPGSADNNGASLRGLEMDHAVRDRL